MANTQQLVDYKQEAMYPNVVLESLFYDENNDTSGRNALLKSLYKDAYPDAEASHYYVFSKAGSKDITSIVNSKCITGLANFDNNISGLTESYFVKVNGDGSFTTSSASGTSVGTAEVADHVKNKITFSTGAGSENYDGSAAKNIDSIKRAYTDKNEVDITTYIHAVEAVSGHSNQISIKTGNTNAQATTITINDVAKATDASTAEKIKGIANTGLVYASLIGEGNVATLSVAARPTATSVNGFVPIINWSNNVPTVQYTAVGSEGLGGGGSKLKNANSGSKYYIIGASSDADVDATLTNVYKGSNNSPYFKDGNLYQTSDETLKTFTEDIDINLDNLATIKKGLFYWKNDENKVLDIGVSAQTVEPLFPEIVSETDGIKAVSYSKLSVVALAAIDKLYKRIQELEHEVEELKKSK